MNESKQQDRARYLEKKFPRPVSREWHAPGRFTEQVLDYFAHPLRIDLSRAGARYVAIDAMELGGNPDHEEIRLRFRLVKDLRLVEPPRWGGMNEPLVGSTEPVYYFSLSAESSLEANVEDLRTFVAEHLEDELVPSLTELAKQPSLPPAEQRSLEKKIEEIQTHVVESLRENEQSVKEEFYKLKQQLQRIEDAQVKPQSVHLNGAGTATSRFLTASSLAVGFGTMGLGLADSYMDILKLVSPGPLLYTGAILIGASQLLHWARKKA